MSVPPPSLLVHSNSDGADSAPASPSSPAPIGAGLVDVRILKIRPLIPPACLLEELPPPVATQAHVIRSRAVVSDIIHGRDDRMLVVIGPCSIHDPAAALEYARRLKPLAERHSSTLFIVMRAYLEKPRTTVGWKGLINDPGLDGTFHINRGLRVSRRLLLDLNGLGLPLAMEMLDPIIPQFLADLISWAAIGARTTESQLHRELVSGLSMVRTGRGGAHTPRIAHTHRDRAKAQRRGREVSQQLQVFCLLSHSYLRIRLLVPVHFPPLPRTPPAADRVSAHGSRGRVEGAFALTVRRWRPSRRACD
jgi:hypothetical protein